MYINLFVAFLIHIHYNDFKEVIKSMTIYERIKARRKELDLTADEVAKALGISRATVYRYESSEIEKLPITILEPLAKVLKTTPSYLMGWTDQPSLTLEEQQLFIDFRSLNSSGQDKAIDYVSDLADNPKYQKETEVQEMPEPYVIEAAAAHHKTGVYDETDRRDISKMNEIARKINEQRQK